MKYLNLTMVENMFIEETFNKLSVNDDSFNLVPSLINGIGNEINTSPQKNSIKSSPDETFKSAFCPYRQTQSIGPTVLTNLQRGNTQAPALTPTIIKPNYHMKAGQGELIAEDILLQKDVDILDTNGLTALHWACSYGQLHTVSLLLKYNADINKMSPDEETPLIFAASGGHHEIVKLLLNNNANVDHMDHLCNTALMYAAKGNYPHSCQELLDNGANIRLINFNDNTALDIAIENISTAVQAVLQNHILSLLDNPLKEISDSEIFQEIKLLNLND